MTRKVTFHTSPSVTVGLLFQELHTVVRASTNFSKIYKPIPSSSRQKYGTKQVPTWGPTIVELHRHLALSARCTWTDIHFIM